MWGVCHIFASFNDTFVHVTDLSGKETLVGAPALAEPFQPGPLPQGVPQDPHAC